MQAHDRNRIPARQATAPGGAGEAALEHPTRKFNLPRGYLQYYGMLREEPAAADGDAAGKPQRAEEAKHGEQESGQLRNEAAAGAAGGGGAAAPASAPGQSAGQPAAAPTGARTSSHEDARVAASESVMPTGAPTVTVSDTHSEPQGDRHVAHTAVAPSGAPTVVNGGGNDCTPDNEQLDWDAIDDGANWRANVTALRVGGTIHITPWPSSPTAMTVPNTANPVDGGNINNTSGSPNHWQTVIDDMADYDTVGGGAGPNWHATQASHDHEWAHWNEDYMQDALGSAGHWTDVNRNIDAVRVPKASAADAAAARTALQPEVNRLFTDFVRAVTVRWNHLINVLDKPGKGGRGYAAGTRILTGLISRVRTYATSKGWAGSTSGAVVGAVGGAVVGGAVGGPIGAVVGGAIGGLVGSLF